MSNNVLVIGYGNDLRCDDAIGQRVAEKIATQDLANVKSIAVHQLTPELAANLANVDLAIFVDACFNCENSKVQVKSLLPATNSYIAGHLSNPQTLLALTQTLYSYYPQTWWVIVPGENFELGDRLSPVAQRGVAIALEKITSLINQAKTNSSKPMRRR
ncbi:hydrogenase maturation protease [Chlorogloeopsis fritschii PCC 9212]|uniref:Hydrogenase maturation protease n=1 Tax=Chlorogloeopsis fritschii PCC 6912 TaxID=211165 RepID=A0A3S0XHA7_CHLFR|nr:hydrogenase maturation protease [Chlorogloeopsis fritschii]RUR72885.1 hydrogenase maturation protease [Chlorogloeopsis fritschii PCC 6912]